MGFRRILRKFVAAGLLAAAAGIPFIVIYAKRRSPTSIKATSEVDWKPAMDAFENFARKNWGAALTPEALGHAAPSRIAVTSERMREFFPQCRFFVKNFPLDDEDLGFADEPTQMVVVETSGIVNDFPPYSKGSADYVELQDSPVMAAIITRTRPHIRSAEQARRFVELTREIEGAPFLPFVFTKSRSQTPLAKYLKETIELGKVVDLDAAVTAQGADTMYTPVSYDTTARPTVKHEANTWRVEWITVNSANSSRRLSAYRIRLDAGNAVVGWESWISDITSPASSPNAKPLSRWSDPKYLRSCAYA